MFGKKNNYINLTEKEKKQLMKNMTGKQKKIYIYSLLKLPVMV